MPAMTLLYITLAALAISAVAAAFIKWSVWADNKAPLDEWDEEWDQA
jgi:hypothetical protein